MRKAITAALTLPLLALALAFGTGTAHASDNSNGAVTYANNAYCGGAFFKNQPVAGFVNFHLSADTTSLQVLVHMKDAAPDATYYIYQYGGFCTYDNFLGTITTNDNGVGNLATTVTVPAGQGSYFVFMASTAGDAESVSVTP